MNDTIALLRWGYFVCINKLLILHPIHVRNWFLSDPYFYTGFLLYIRNCSAIIMFFCSPCSNAGGFCLYGNYVYLSLNKT